MMKNNVKTIFLSSRPISWVNTAFPFVVGYLFLSHQVDSMLIIGGLYFLIPYNLMMYGVNDVFDYESDLRNPRKGGVEGALLAPSLHRPLLILVAILNIPFIIILIYLGDLTSSSVLLFSVFMALAYSVPILRFKERPIIDSITSSFHFVSPLLFAISLVGWKQEYLPYVVAFFAWGMASHAFGAVQDIIADRKAQIQSIATKYGAKLTSRIALILYALTSFVVLMQGGWAVIVGLVLMGYVFMVAPYVNLKDRDAEKANNGWKFFLMINQLTGFTISLIIILNY